ncbi:hypothetical protein RJ639_047745 [Escallonia herrerae]|uniref:Uncharacterized protein n=1 Tax=Escallonia herrerae TaxID=1293975 RepID=A0AA89AXG2_9ASTE|nr:hypothetical protein RJ639_047745 [Escallonia herrerae]
MASQSINLAASSTIKVLERPDLLSPQRIQASVNDQLHKVMSPIQKPDFSLLALKGSSSLHATRGSTHIPTESAISQCSWKSTRAHPLADEIWAPLRANVHLLHRRVRQNGLRRRQQLEQWALDGDIGIGAYDHGGSTIIEKSLPNEGVHMGVRGSTESDDSNFGADDEDASTGVVLGEILSQVEDGAAGEAALLVHHEPLDRGAEAEELGELVVGAKHVDAGGGADDEVGDFGVGLAPLLDGLGGGFLP